MHSGAELGTVADADDHRATGQGAVVDAHHTGVGMDRLVSHDLSVIANIPRVKMRSERGESLDRAGVVQQSERTTKDPGR
ncbi:hypothetical protein GCM10022267_56610 [Lentzea roselyniae]|uniref:Uncharacterized protein n=1 Tax=Lentzea roselyniae TaxID=531940 RepID=A0ABP7BME6_9PSEU